MSNSIATYIPESSESTTMSKIGSRSFWMAFCLTFPAVSKILFPSSIEKLLEIQLLGIPIFLPNLLLAIFFVRSQKNYGNLLLKHIFWLQFLFMFIGFLYNRYDHSPFAFLLAGNFYYYILLLGMYCRINLQERLWVGRILAITLLVLGLEVFLLGLGIINGFGAMDIAEEAQQFGDVFRVGTTAGAATGTAAHLYMLTVICVMLSNSAKWRYFLFIFGFSATLLTVSRGGAFAFFMYLFIWLYHKAKEKGSGRKLKKIIGFMAALTLLYYIGVFNPLIERITIKAQTESMFESREDRSEKALQLYQRADSKLLGVGIANMFRSMEMHHLGYDNLGAPHNSYVQTLCEQGIIGLVLMVLFWYIFIVINRKKFPILMSILPLLLVLWNTESSIVVNSDCVTTVAILMMLALDKNRQKDLKVM